MIRLADANGTTFSAGFALFGLLPADWTRFDAVSLQRINAYNAVGMFLLAQWQCSASAVVVLSLCIGSAVAVHCQGCVCAVTVQ